MPNPLTATRRRAPETGNAWSGDGSLETLYSYGVDPCRPPYLVRLDNGRDTTIFRGSSDEIVLTLVLTSRSLGSLGPLGLG